MPSSEVFGAGDSIELSRLIPRYQSGGLSPKAVITEVLRRVEAYGDPSVWITRVPADQVFAQLDSAEAKIAAGIPQPLLGIPFAVKDNIDVAGQPTTAACPAFRYIADRSAHVVQQLCDAGAIVIGKTNLDQFATGLVGMRSPYGACRNVFDPRYISGGSSSGSAVAVAAGLVSFALGTDTAGSGRVPAAFNNLVGLKPSCGRLSTSGVVPACKSLDCVSIFTHSCDEARLLLRIAEGYDPSDPYSRDFTDVPPSPSLRYSEEPDRTPKNPALRSTSETGLPGPNFRFGVLAAADREFFGDDEAAKLYEASITAMEKLGGRAAEIDFTPFTSAAALLYFGPWVAERSMVARGLLKNQPDALLSVTRGILEAGLKLSGIAVFEGLHRLESLKQQAAAQWKSPRKSPGKSLDFLLLPTTGTIYTIEQVTADPLGTNTNLGRYTNFVNLLNLCAVAIPAGFRSNGIPAGVSIIAPAGCDDLALDVASALHSSTHLSDVRRN